MKPILFFLVIIFVVACKPDPERTPVDLITYSDVRAFEENENWIIAWNSKGELLDYKKYAPNEIVTLRSTGDISDNKITIGFLLYSGGNDYKSHDIVIYTDVVPGQSFSRKLSPASNISIDYTKTFTVNVPSNGDHRFLSISNESGFLSGGVSGSDDFQANVTISPTDKYNVMYRTDDAVRHKILSNVKTGDVINLTESDFSLYEHQQTYTYPPGQVNIFVNGFTPGMSLGTSGVVLDFYLGGEQSTSITTGYYGNSFTHFAFGFDHSTDNGNQSVQFGKIGSLPTSLNIPGPISFPVTNKDPFNMTISSPSNVLFHEVKWGNQLYVGDGPKTAGYVAWKITGSSDEVTIGDLPDEILATYPMINIDASHYMQSRIFLGPQTYSEYLTVELNGNFWDEYEQTSIRSK